MVAESYNRMSQDWGAGDEPLMSRCQHAAEDMLQDYPLVITLGAFAVGVGIGVAIGSSLARPLGLQQEMQAERIGRKVLDSIAEFLPGSVRQYVR